ncbi:StsA family sactipeptide RiPP [Streptomyces sp. NPDC000941]
MIDTRSTRASRAPLNGRRFLLTLAADRPNAESANTNREKGRIVESPVWVKPEMLPIEFDIDQPCSCDCSGGAGAGSGNAESEPRLEI